MATDRANGSVNYLTNSERQADIPAYNALVYRDLWPGVDMAFRGAGGKLKYEFGSPRAPTRATSGLPTPAPRASHSGRVER